MSNHKPWWRLTAFALITAVSATAQERPATPPQSPTQVLEILRKSQVAFYYPGADMKAKVVMNLITDAGQKRTRMLTMLRRNDPKNENQKYFMYFQEPGDVRRMAFLVWKYPERDDDRWIFIPALNMTRRVAASDSRSSFVGSDFTYEDISGRDLSADTHSLLREEKLGTTDCFVVQSIPKRPADYAKKMAWIGKQTFLPLKEEYYDAQNQLARVFTAEKVEEITAQAGGKKASYPIVTLRAMKNVKSGHRTEVALSGVTLHVGLEDAVFTERSLQNPPAKWIQ